MRTYEQIMQGAISNVRVELMDGLAQCTDVQHRLFKLMYANGDLELDIDEVVAKMPKDKLEWAMQQVQATLDKQLHREEQ